LLSPSFEVELLHIPSKIQQALIGKADNELCIFCNRGSGACSSKRVSDADRLPKKVCQQFSPGAEATTQKQQQNDPNHALSRFLIPV